MPAYVPRVGRRTNFLRAGRRIPLRRPFTTSGPRHTEAMADGEPTSNTSTSTSASTSSPKKPQLALPDRPASDSTTTVLDVSNGGTSIRLDHLGPMVVAVDGTVSRISNWETMADIEKKNTLRMIGKRNQARLEALRGHEGKS